METRKVKRFVVASGVIIILMTVFMLSYMAVGAAGNDGHNMEMVLKSIKAGKYGEAEAYCQKMSRRADEKCVKEIPANIKKVFKNTVEEYLKKYGTFYTHDYSEAAKYVWGYFLTDIDNDGNADFLIEYGSCEADVVTDAFLYRNSKAEKVGTFVSDHSNFCAYEGHNGIVRQQGHMGEETTKLISVENGQLKVEKYGDRSLGDNENYLSMGCFLENCLDNDVLGTEASEWYKEKHTTYWDITNNNKDDKIEFLPSGGDYQIKTGFGIKINGEKAFTTKKQSYVSYTVRKLSIKGKNYLYLCLNGDSNSGPAYLLAFKNKKMVKAIDMGVSNIENIKVKENRVIAKVICGDIPGLGAVRYQSVYNCTGYGSFSHKPENKILSYTHNNKWDYKGNLVTQKAITIYSDYNGKSFKDTIPKGSKVKAVECYMTKRLCAVHLKGKKYNGWYVSTDYDSSGDVDMLFKGVYGVG